jgi:enoyl-CoA hydratase/carnithine racemase
MPSDLGSRTEHLPRASTDARGRLIALTEEQIRARNAGAIRALDELSEIGDEDEQRATLDALMKALGPDRSISSRPLFP